MVVPRTLLRAFVELNNNQLIVLEGFSWVLGVVEVDVGGIKLMATSAEFFESTIWARSIERHAYTAHQHDKHFFSHTHTLYLLDVLSSAISGVHNQIFPWFPDELS